MAEDDDEVESKPKRGRPQITDRTVKMRLSDDDYDSVDAVAKSFSESWSAGLRRMIRRHEKTIAKALSNAEGGATREDFDSLNGELNMIRREVSHVRADSNMVSRKLNGGDPVSMAMLAKLESVDTKLDRTNDLLEQLVDRIRRSTAWQ